MTLKEAVDRFDHLYPNPLTIAEKRKILSDFDGQLFAQVLVHYEGTPDIFTGYDETAAPDTALLVPYPYDDVYLKLLCAETDAVCGDTARYNNSAALFNAAYEQYVAHVNRTRTRRDGLRLRFDT